jgi:sarcosine oxidase delta subunit
MICDPDKPKYATEREALDSLARARRKSNGGKAVRWLGAYQCGDHFHLGHDTLNKKIKETAAQERKANRQTKTRQKVAAKSNRKALAELGYFHSVAESARIAKHAIDDLNDSLIIARQLAAEIFAGKRPA